MDKNMEILIPYGRSKKKITIAENRIEKIVHCRLNEYRPEKSEQELIRDAMACPIGSSTLRELAQNRKKVVIIASDHTRPVPSRLIMPEMLREIREGNPEAEITILIATGCHRETSREELVGKFGEEIVEKENIVVHDCDSNDMTFLGYLPSGGELWINSIAANADLLVSEGFIEPHFFAGYSGGRKSVLPGIAKRETVYANHCAEFINSSEARCGVLDDNPIHRDMIYAAEQAHLAYIVNVVINSAHEVVGAFAGDVNKAHRAGCEFLDQLSRECPVQADIVVTSNNGYPLDQNIYQAVKGLCTAADCVKENGVIIMFAECEDGIGGEGFYRTFKEAASAREVLEEISAVPQSETKADQWQSQILARILCKCSVIFVSAADDQIVRDLHMIPASSFEEALQKAEEITGEESRIVFVPEGITSFFA